MKWAIPALILMLGLQGYGQAVDPVVMLDVNTRPASIGTSELAGFTSLPNARRQLIETALAVAWQSPWLPYLAGGADPDDGGFDCSGAMYFVMRKAGLDPPRSSGVQMEWLRKHGRLRVVAADARDLKHRSFSELKPGDLLFWAVSAHGGTIRVHHVAMYLGTEKKDGRPVMIGSTDGRSYRGQKANGYGVHDLRIPKAESPSKLIGYGTPPGIDVE
jgi:cell wall-associated NlpC family hydrolase